MSVFSCFFYYFFSSVHLLTVILPFHDQTVTSHNAITSANETFIAAVDEAVVELLGGKTTVTDITLSKHGRRLLSSVNLIYTVSVANGMNSGDIAKALKDSMDSGEFASTLSLISGLAIDSVTDLRTIDLSPTTAPTDTPAQPNQSGLHILYYLSFFLAVWLTVRLFACPYASTFLGLSASLTKITWHLI